MSDQVLAWIMVIGSVVVLAHYLKGSRGALISVFAPTIVAGLLGEPLRDVAVTLLPAILWCAIVSVVKLSRKVVLLRTKE